MQEQGAPQARVSVAATEGRGGSVRLACGSSESGTIHHLLRCVEACAGIAPVAVHNPYSGPIRPCDSRDVD